jgi:hypothetical protein
LRVEEDDLFAAYQDMLRNTQKPIKRWRTALWLYTTNIGTLRK